MYEEPVAMKLVKHGWHEKRVADDYLISPVESRRFSQIVMGRRIQHNGILVAKLSEKAADKDELISELEKLATEDDLTKIKNRRYMWEFFRQIIERAKKENLQATLLVFDIDDFKHYNDSYGHTVGDAILKQVAILMRRCCRKHDVVGRIGGDEFAVIFWDCPSEANSEQDDSSSAEAGSERRTIHAEHPKDAIILADRLRKELNSAESPLLGKEGKGELTISGGLASFPRDGKNVEQLFEQADKALLQAKHSGKNRIYLVGGPREDIAENSKL